MTDLPTLLAEARRIAEEAKSVYGSPELHLDADGNGYWVRHPECRLAAIVLAAIPVIEAALENDYGCAESECQHPICKALRTLTEALKP